MLLKWHDLPSQETHEEDCPPVERILTFDISTDEVVTINIFRKDAFPLLRSYQQILQAHKTKALSICEEDPFAKLAIPEDKIKHKHREYRDAAWEDMAPLLEHEDAEFLLYSWKRGPLVRAHSKNTVRENKCDKTVKLSVTTINRRLRLWWQSGRRKNAYLPNFDSCGAPGKARVADTPQIDKSHPKVGRRSALALSKGRADTGVGLRMSADIYRRFEFGYNKFYKNSEQRTLRDVYELTIQKYFAIDYEIVDGNPVPIIPSEDELPTFNQFYYWYKNVRDDVKEKRAREGDIKFELTSRRMLGDSRKMGFAPGSIYQIDATIPNLYLVSEFDSTRIIGRPVLYNAIDVFSGALTGLCLLLEGPSWHGAMLALDNVTMDKVAFCAEYGFEIAEDEWPCMGLPTGILADRGEFEGYNADTLVNSFGIRVHNTGVWRADWKGFVERSFGIADDRVVKFTPGYVPPPGRARGDPDYALRAALTPNEFRKLIIAHALDYNMNHYLKGYRKNEFMVADHVPLYPLEIWNWGIRSRGGLLTKLDQDIVRLNLLPRRQATVTPRGIHLFGEHYYTCDLAERQGWFERARMRGEWKIEVAHHPRTTTFIYLPFDGTKLVRCHRTPASMNLPARDWYDAMDYHVLEQASYQASETRRLQSGANLKALKDAIVSKAVERSRIALAAVGPVSKRARRGSIRMNRASEKHVESTQNTWVLGGKIAKDDANRKLLEDVPGISEPGDEYVPPSSKINRIGELLEKEWSKDE
jgi:hypothetical protein